MKDRFIIINNKKEISVLDIGHELVEEEGSGLLFSFDCDSKECINYLKQELDTMVKVLNEQNEIITEVDTMGIQKDICNMIQKIDNEESLKEIAKFCKEKMAISLDEYIDIELKCAPDSVKNKFKCEAIDFYCKLEESEVTTELHPCGDWCDLMVEGLDLSDWIAGDYPTFNPLRLAICIYKIWIKEIRIE